MRSNSNDVTHTQKAPTNFLPTAVRQNGEGSEKGGKRMERQKISNFLRSHLSKLIHGASDYYYFRLFYRHHRSKRQHHSKVENEMAIFPFIRTSDSHHT